MWRRAAYLAGVQCQRWGMAGELRYQWQQTAQIHACCVELGNGGSSGDKGPERNYRRKMKKKMMKSATARVVLDHLKGLQEPDVASGEKHDGDSVKKLLSEIKVYVPTSAEVRKRLGMPEKYERVTRQLKDKGRRETTGCLDPKAGGRRLGIFEPPKPGTGVMEQQGPNFAEEDEQQFLKSLLLMKHRNQYEVAMDDTKFPRGFPIDNEDYETEEHLVGFEEHVLLDHLLDGFPKKGPVRHFMELVVTGLSRNPHYSAQEKRDYVQWYKKYFSNFTPEELQSVSPPNHQDKIDDSVL